MVATLTYGVPAAPASRPPRPLPHVAASRPRLTLLSPPLDSIYLAPPVTNGASDPISPVHRDSLATSGMHLVIEVDGLGNQRHRRRLYIHARSNARDELSRLRDVSSRGPSNLPRDAGAKPFYPYCNDV